MEIDQDVVETLVQHARAGDLEAFMAQGDGCGWCRHPVRVQGKRTCIDPVTAKRVVVFDTRSLPDGVVLKACGSRRETRCPSCSAVYGGDARHLVRAGLEGGADSDEDHSHRPAVLLTLTAPSFGAVHRATVSGAPCRPGSPSTRCPHGRRLFCFERHDDAEEFVGTPLCPDCYDYEGAVIHNAVVPELWRRTSIYLPRCLARVMGLTQAQCGRRFRISYLRVAEFQRRGAIHLHVIVRLDCLAGEDLESPAALLASACLAAVRSVGVTVAGRTHRWGPQADVGILERDESRAGRLAAYVAKYATKSSDDSGSLDRRIQSEEDLARRRLRPHERRLATSAWALGAKEELSGLHLRRHAHLLGYGGHFLCKSRSYSTTFSALRGARVAWREAHRPRGPDEPPGCRYEARWKAVGVGWATRGEALLAEGQREAAAYARRVAAQTEVAR